MKVGVSLMFQNYTDWDRYLAAEADPTAPASLPVLSDTQVYRDHLHLGRLVEPLGFDSIWTVEHHFTPYTMVTNPLQLLTYFAGCTERVDMGAMVIVLPWHDPIRVVEGIIALDHMLDGRKMRLGFGRGLGDREFNGMRVSMNEARERFLEQLDIIKAALGNEWFSYDGTHYQIPRTSMRPMPSRPTLFDDFYCAWGSPSSLPLAASSGLKPLFVLNKTWAEYSDELDEFNKIRAQHDLPAERPSVATWIYCAETEDEAREAATRYMGEYGASASLHYKLTGDHFSGLKDYEHYANVSKDMQGKDHSAFGEPYVENHIWGTPEQCREKLAGIHRSVDADEMIAVFSYGSMPLELAEKSMRLFAKEVLPFAQSLQPSALPAGELV